MSNESIKSALWWLCLLVAPAILLSVELFHPAGFTRDPGMFEYLSQAEAHSAQHKALGYFGPQWWFALHMIQTPMMGLVAVGLWLHVDRIAVSDGTGALIFAWLSRGATFVFLVFYTALDAIGGIGLGRTLEITRQLIATGGLTPAQVEGVKLVLNTTWIDPWVGGVGSFISLTGSWAVFISTVFAGIGLFMAKKAPWPALILLVAFGWELQIGHPMPHGPIAFTLLIISSFWIWWKTRRSGV